METGLFFLTVFAFIGSRRSSRSEYKDATAVLPDLHGGKIFKFILTGGPCGGKTTAIARLQGFLKERGFRVYIAPEAATIMFLNGVTVDDFSNARLAPLIDIQYYS